jgi:hypothetical protein
VVLALDSLIHGECNTYDQIQSDLNAYFSCILQVKCGKQLYLWKQFVSTRDLEKIPLDPHMSGYLYLPSEDDGNDDARVKFKDWRVRMVLQRFSLYNEYIEQELLRLNAKYPDMPHEKRRVLSQSCHAGCSLFTHALRFLPCSV